MGGGGSGLVAVLVLAVLVIPLLSATVQASAGGPPLAPASDPGPAPAAYVPFSPNIKVNSVTFGGMNYQVEPTMAINSTGTIFVGWKEAFTHNGGGQRVSFSRSTDGGDTWAPNILMPLATLSHQSDPWLTVTRDDRVFFSRIEYDSTSLPGGIAITNTTDGATLGTTWYLNDAPNFADKQSHANDAPGNVYMVWNSDSANYALVFSRSNDGGRTWTPRLRIADLQTGSLGGIVKVAPDGTVLATWWSWLTDDVWFDRSFDGGATWGTDIRVNDLPGSAASPGASDPPVLPAMVVAPNGTIYVAYEDYRNGDMDVYFARSTDGGTTWSPGARLNDDNTTARQWMPDLAIDPFGGIHVAWEDDRTGAHNIFYTNSTDGGTTWSPNIPVTTASTPLSYTRPGDYLAIESDPWGNLCVVWTDGRGADLDIYFAKLLRSVRHTVDTVPAGLIVGVDGQQYNAPASFSWAPGSRHEIQAPSPQPVTAQTRRVFESWSDGGGVVHTVTAQDSETTFTATFRTEHLVTVRSAPVPLSLLVDGVPITQSTDYWWADGSPHAISAPSPQAGAMAGERYAFRAWSDGLPASHTVAPAAPTTFEAEFQRQFLLTVASPRGTPTGGGWYNASDIAGFSVPDEVAGGTGTRYLFAGWSGDSTASTAAASLPMDGPRTVTATWRTEHLLTIVSPRGTPQGAGWHAEGSQVSVSIEDTVTENGTTYRFAGWSGDATAPSSLVLVPMDRPKTLTATWEVVPPTDGPTGLAPDPLPWILVIAVLVIAILLVIVWRRRRRKEDEVPPPPT
ncbi:MAG TPA: sialidase family protein [Thermoplasmata archaeon]|nr:sialidase family protein [Thermoplasmata archaeon]